jgi:hypothetical protein
MTDQKLKEAAEKYRKELADIERDFIAGAQWQAEQMKELVEALEKIEKLTIWNNQSLEQDFHDANEIARQALKKYRGSDE